jgi:hypothetical protein
MLAVSCAAIFGMEEGEPLPAAGGAAAGGGGSAGAGATGGSQAGNGGAADLECVDVNDCLGSHDECLEPECDNGVCRVVPKDLYTACHGNQYCDGDGNCVECINNNHTPCPNGEQCLSFQCVTPSCTNMLQDGDETDVDCGGSCAPCALGKACTDPSDCQSLYCAGTCQSCDSHGQCPSGHYCDLNGASACMKLKDWLQSCQYDYECVTGKCSNTAFVCTYT